MRRLAVIFLVLAAAFAVPGGAFADHNPPGGAIPTPGDERVPNQGGEGAQFELVETLLTGNPHTDLDFFTQGGVTYASVGTLAAGGNNAGQTIVKLTDEKGDVSKDTVSFVSGHPSATCVTNPRSALGLQHDVEATPKGRALSNSTSTRPVKRDTQLIIDATDATGRCHDQGVAGVIAAPRGGLEIVDVTDLKNPVEIGLTSHIGEAHTVNIDPKRPHIAYAVTSDAVGIAKDTNDIDGDGNKNELIRLNEDPNGTGGNALDGFEVVDLSSCMNVNDRASFGRNANIAKKRGVDPATGDILENRGCRPEVYRFRYPSLRIGLGHTRQTGNQGLFGCHETEIYQNDLLTCGGGNAAILFDVSRAFNDMGTPRDFTDDKPRGKPLPCRVRESTTVLAPFRTEAPVTDCVVGKNDVDLRIPNWLKIGRPGALKGVKHVGSAHHQGRGAQPEENEEQEESTGVTTAFNAKQDIDFNHETELTHSGDFLIATDERGGGVVPPGATCSPGIDNPDGNGGLHAYAVDRLDTQLPDSAKEAFDAYALTPQGDKAIIRAEVNTQTEATFCTAHVMQQVPGQKRIFMGWYTQGTRVFDYKENKDGTFQFAEVAHFIPTNANEWVSHVFKVDKNSDGSFTYYGVAADFFFGTAGRNAIDVYKATLPPVGSVFKSGGGTGPGGDGPGGDGDDPLDRDGDGVPDGDGTGGTGAGGPTLPATGGGMGVMGLGVALLGASAWVGRSRRRSTEVS